MLRQPLGRRIAGHRREPRRTCGSKRLERRLRRGHEPARSHCAWRGSRPLEPRCLRAHRCDQGPALALSEGGRTQDRGGHALGRRRRTGADICSPLPKRMEHPQLASHTPAFDPPPPDRGTGGRSSLGCVLRNDARALARAPAASTRRTAIPGRTSTSSGGLPGVEQPCGSSRAQRRRILVVRAFVRLRCRSTRFACTARYGSCGSGRERLLLRFSARRCSSAPSRFSRWTLCGIHRLSGQRRARALALLSLAFAGESGRRLQLPVEPE